MSPTTVKVNRLVLAGIGLLQGAIFWATSGKPDATPQATLWACAIATGLAAQFIWTGRHIIRWSVLSGTLGAVASAVSFWVFDGRLSEVNGLIQERVQTWAPAAFVMLYVLVPFAQIGQRSGRFGFPYLQLFTHSWNNFFVGLIGATFLGAFALLVVLGEGLFGLLDVEWFRNVVRADPFVYLAYPTLFGLGIAIGRESETATDTLRRIALAICYGLLPVASGLALAFLLTLPFAGLQPLWYTGQTTPLLLTLVGFIVLFLNGVFQDGRPDPPYIKVVRHGVESSVVLTPLLVCLAAYSTALRVDQYGLTPDRVWAILLISVAALYSITYFTAVILRRSGWMALIKPANTWIAVVIAALAVLSHTPVLDPLGLSARNQAQRLIQGRVEADAFDFVLMQFELGRTGRVWLEELAELEHHPDRDRIRELVRLTQSQTYWDSKRTQILLRAKPIQTIPPLRSLPPGLFQAIASGYYRGGLEHSLYVYRVDLDADNNPEYCVFRATPLMPMQRCLAYSDDQGWFDIGDYVVAEGSSLTGEALVESLQAAGVTPEPPLPPRFSDLRIGDSVFRLQR